MLDLIFLMEWLRRKDDDVDVDDVDDFGDAYRYYCVRVA
jgi:hypothetical protein